MKVFSPPAWTEDTEYQALAQKLGSLKLLSKTPLRYSAFAFVISALFAGGFLLLLISHHPAMVILAAVITAFPRAWMGYLAHDIAHGAVFSSKKLSYIGTVFAWPLLLGISGMCWKEKHDRHHERVNCVNEDPDIHVPAYLSSAQWKDKNALQKLLPNWVIQSQHIYFFFLLPLMFVSFLIESFRYYFSHPFSFEKVFELMLMGVHYAVFYGAVFGLLGGGAGVLFLFVHMGVVSTLLALAFAPNHKGRDMFPSGENITWKHQIIATRNIYPSVVVDFLYGGLNYQIEHHLFPYMSRFNLRQARNIIKQFCIDHGLVYYETSPWNSLVEIYQTLKANRQYL